MTLKKKYFREQIRVRAGKKKNICRLCKRDLESHYGYGSHCPLKVRERMIAKEDLNV